MIKRSVFVEFKESSFSFISSLSFVISKRSFRGKRWKNCEREKKKNNLLSCHIAAVYIEEGGESSYLSLGAIRQLRRMEDEEGEREGEERGEREKPGSVCGRETKTSSDKSVQNNQRTRRTREKKIIGPEQNM